MRKSALFGTKKFEIYGVSARSGGRVEPVQTIFEQVGKGVNFFHDLVRTSFIGGPLFCINLNVKMKHTNSTTN